jgi:hypothetical protein
VLSIPLHEAEEDRGTPVLFSCLLFVPDFTPPRPFKLGNHDDRVTTFGVAGTIIGAALTAMIINGGSAIYRVYIESASSKIRELPGTVRIRSADRRGADLTSEAHPSPEQPEPQRNFLGRFRAALSSFPSLPRFRRRSILIGALAAGAASFLLSMGADHRRRVWRGQEPLLPGVG